MPTADSRPFKAVPFAVVAGIAVKTFARIIGRVRHSPHPVRELGAHDVAQGIGVTAALAAMAMPAIKRRRTYTTGGAADTSALAPPDPSVSDQPDALELRAAAWRAAADAPMPATSVDIAAQSMLLDSPATSAAADSTAQPKPAGRLSAARPDTTTGSAEAGRPSDAARGIQTTAPAAQPAHRQAPAAGRGVFAIAKEAVMAWFADGGPRLGASIAFYTIFALAPLMLILVGIAGFFFGEEAARGQIFSQIEGLVGADAAKTIQDILASAHKNEGHGLFGTIVSVGTALIGASAVFIELKNAFDTIFHPKPQESTINALVRARLMAVALVLALGFLVVVSLVLSAGVAAFGKWLGGVLPFLAPILSLLDVALSTAVLTAAFYLLIRYLPDQAPKPRAILIGALTSALLFAIGKHLIGLYLARGAVASAYGAAGSLIVTVLWVYYSSQILLLGAEVSRSVDNPDKAADKAAEGRAQVAAATSR